MARIGCLNVVTIIASLFLGVCVDSMGDEWRGIRFSRPGGERISCIEGVEGTDTIYAGTSGGVYVSRDLGGEWHREKLPGNSLRVNGIRARGNMVSVSSEEGLFIKEGGDPSWRQTYGERDLKGLCFSGYGPEIITWTPTRIYSVSEEIWKDITPGTMSGEVGNVITDGDTLYASSGGEIVFWTRDTGEWIRVTLVSGREEELETDIEREDEDHGEDIIPGPQIRDIAPMEPEGVIVTTGKGIYKVRKGVFPERIDTTGLPSAKVVTALWSGKGIFAATDKKIFFYPADAYSWKSVLEVSDGGFIREMKIHRLPDGRKMLLAVLSEKLYIRPLDSFLDDACSMVNGRSETPGVLKVGPDIRTVHEMAIEYAEVSPEKISSWRKAAEWRSVLPRVAFKYDEGYSDKVEFYKSASTAYIMEGPRDKRDSWGVTLTWELPDLIWNSSQTSIDVRSKLMVQLRDDILEDVTRLYFERKRLVEESLRQEEKDRSKTGSVENRIEELTAYIDAYTGGMFSKATYASEDP